MKLQLLAKHFVGASFGRCDSCAIAKALMEAMSTEDVVVGYAFAYIKGVKLSFDPYFPNTHAHDEAVARLHNFSHQLIREITLTEAYE